jgi:hypothetical protein
MQIRIFETANDEELDVELQYMIVPVSRQMIWLIVRTRYSLISILRPSNAHLTGSE